LEAYLKKRGISSVLTRRSDKFVSLNGRAAVGNRYNDAVFVSIHFNSASNRSATGIEAFYFTPQSELLAPIVHTNVIHKTRTRDRGVKHRGFRVIRTSRNPSILVEGGFISNRGERRRCLTSTHRKKLAESIGHALVIYRKER
jgi:N-acetylmuramoyl-L-alanine amidase